VLSGVTIIVILTVRVPKEEFQIDQARTSLERVSLGVSRNNVKYRVDLDTEELEILQEVEVNLDTAQPLEVRCSGDWGGEDLN
jgi:hypothetical protein